MKITQTDNRRIRKLRFYLSFYPQGPVDDHTHTMGSSLIAHITYLLDNQSARIARRLTWKEFAGIPASENSPAYIPDRSRYYWESKTAVNSNEYRCAVQLGGEWWKNIIRHGYVPQPQSPRPSLHRPSRPPQVILTPALQKPRGPAPGPHPQEKAATPMNTCTCVTCQQDRALAASPPCVEELSPRSTEERDGVPRKYPLVHLDRQSLPSPSPITDLRSSLLRANQDLRTVSIHHQDGPPHALLIRSTKGVPITCTPFNPLSDADTHAAFTHTLKLARVLDIARQLR